MKLIDWELLNLQVAFTATDGVDALRKLETLPVDILITDVRMPHMNGIELALNTRTKLPLC
jgi:two-component system response regulator YesN